MIGTAEDAAENTAEDTAEDTADSLVEDTADRTVLGLADNAVDLDQTAREQLSKSMKLLLEASV